MAAEAEAAREARAKVIAAEGEMKATRALKEASDVIVESPAALQVLVLQFISNSLASRDSSFSYVISVQLRYLQTLSQISAEKNSTIIFPLPIDLLNAFLPHLRNKNKEKE
jgi:erythrocyte band 7 integral membrane protein